MRGVLKLLPEHPGCRPLFSRLFTLRRRARSQTASSAGPLRDAAASRALKYSLMFVGLEHVAIASPNPPAPAPWYVDHLGYPIQRKEPLP